MHFALMWVLRSFGCPQVVYPSENIWNLYPRPFPAGSSTRVRVFFPLYIWKLIYQELRLGLGRLDAKPLSVPLLGNVLDLLKDVAGSIVTQ